jgi:hypothetical protein
MDNDLAYTRQLLEEWANWIGRGGGYSHQSSVEWFRQGGLGGGVFGSTVPKDVEPSARVARASVAMQHLRLLDGEAARLLGDVYLRRRTVTLLELARRDGVGITLYRSRRHAAERKFSGLLQALLST